MKSNKLPTYYLLVRVKWDDCLGPPKWLFCPFPKCSDDCFHGELLVALEKIIMEIKLMIIHSGPENLKKSSQKNS